MSKNDKKRNARIALFPDIKWVNGFTLQRGMIYGQLADGSYYVSSLVRGGRGSYVYRTCEQYGSVWTTAYAPEHSALWHTLDDMREIRSAMGIYRVEFRTADDLFKKGRAYTPDYSYSGNPFVKNTTYPPRERKVRAQVAYYYNHS